MTSRLQRITTFTQRRMILMIGGVVLVLLLFSRLFYLQVVQQDFLHHQGQLRSMRTETLLAMRGMITDRRGEPLAVSTPTISIWIDPSQYIADPKPLNQLSSLIGMETSKLEEKITQNKEKRFLYLKRHLIPQLTDRIMALRIPGIDVMRDHHRFYPMGAAMSQIVGFTDIDDQGQSGIELLFNNRLRSQEGKIRVLEDRLGQHVGNIDFVRVPQQGKDIQLTIDARLNAMALPLLEETVKKYKAKSATMVMIDIPSGEIIAMCSAPSFNPNNRSSMTAEAMRLRAVTDRFEPGSVFKALLLASAIESGKFKSNTIINTHPGRITVGTQVVRDIRNNGKLTVKEIITKSSNVGVSLMSLSLDENTFTQTLSALGFGSNLDVGFPGESAGKLNFNTDIFTRTTMAFGYGVAVTPLQLANAFATLGRGGLRLDPTVIAGSTRSSPETVFKSQTSKEVLQVLNAVTKEGSGAKAAIAGYETAGKTGTTRLLVNKEYSKNVHNAFFAGVTPLKEPRLSTVILVEEPQDSMGYYGAEVAAPLYRQIVARALLILNVPLDGTKHTVARIS